MPAAATQNQSRPKRLNFIMNGQPAYLAVPPILVSDKPYMAALYLECSTIPYRVHGDTDWLDISTHNGHARLTAQTKSVEIGSAKFTVGAPPVVYEGRWYLPLDLFGRLSGADVQFNAADSCVTYGGRVPLREYRN